jgi:hypothetical protein
MKEQEKIHSILEVQRLAYQKRKDEVEKMLKDLTELVDLYEGKLDPARRNEISALRDRVTEAKEHYDKITNMVVKFNSKKTLGGLIEASKTGKLWTCDADFAEMLKAVGVDPEEVERGINAPGGPEPYIEALLKRLGLNVT